ncbi:hypothetical protein SSX86_019296 [Deinandra increscens subsp. villosa]|uniref:Cysteine-rich receptor-like protein kinase 2 n=1 Tax=Deinandra increscens subsp. villosa TaxID=3103831 RepID=A0AAP0CSC4_9ASTR
MAVFVVLLVLLLLTKPGSSQSPGPSLSNNFFIGMHCGVGSLQSLPDFIRTRNSTFDDLRTQLSSQGVFSARARDLSAADRIFAVAQCRNYLSVDQCVTCFDVAASQLRNCTSGNGGFTAFDNCFVRRLSHRLPAKPFTASFIDVACYDWFVWDMSTFEWYEDNSDFYNNPYVADDVNTTPNVVCGNQSAPQPTVYNQVVDEFLSDVTSATSKISNMYVASTRQITSENATVYVTAQCVLNTSQVSCQTCMNTAYDRLNDCLPSTTGLFFLLGCFARYSDTPFFNANQTVDITNVLKGHKSKVAVIAAAVAGGVFVLIVLVSWFLYRSWKKSKKTEEEEFEGAVHYNYKDLQQATNNFSEENILGKGGFGEVFKAVLDGTDVVAVKKLQIHDAGAKDEFESEVKLISNIHHRNLLRLLGWGYTAPEYAQRGVLSEKVDTYSFGIVILEIISGKRSTEVKSDSQAIDYLLENLWLSWCVLLVLLLLTKPGFPQSNDGDINRNLFIQTHCGGQTLLSLPNFINNRNSSFNELRTQLLSKGALYARAQALGTGDPVFAAVQCRKYISVDQCVACFDDGASRLANCTSGNGGFVSFYNCYIRYESYSDFYDNPYVMDDANRTPNVICGNQSAPQPTVYNQVADGLLSDIKDATPQTANLYVSSTRRITNENATVYVTAQCAENISQSICQTCMNTAYDRLNDCLPSTTGLFFHLGCFARYSDTPFFNANQTVDITNVLKEHKSKVAVIAAAVAGAVLVLIVLVSWLLYRSWKKSKKTEEEEFEGAVHYNYKDLQQATNNFSEENILGKGGFGEVFKAVLDGTDVVAVKKLQLHNAGVKEEFESEVKLISNIQHRNLLRLFGWSVEGSYLLLVLEYMPNGSLDRFLWGSKRGTLNWNQRYEIIFGIARGLAHLHHEFHIKIIHRDIKSNNILLTEDFKPKIADFGLARFHPEDQSHVSTKFAGTLGYTAPEYALRGVLSEKVDTYSFGIVILEIISGKRSTEVKSDSQSIDYLLENTWKLYEKKVHIKVVDETLNLNQHEQEHVTKIIEIALLCTQSPASSRPTMSEVVLMLQEGQSLGKRQLTRPTFINNQDRRIYIGSSRPKNTQATQQSQ